MYSFPRLVVPVVAGVAALTAGCGGSGQAGRAPDRADAASAQLTSSQPHPREIAFLRRQFASVALAPELHVYADGSAYLLVPNGGAGVKRAHCRLPAALVASVRSEAAALPQRDVVGPRGSGDTFLLRANGHTAAASQTRVPSYMRAIVRQLAGVIDNQDRICQTTDRFYKP
ncbi:MAG: hypothetical protein ACXVTC_24280 [Solirubrobacteraceae bacterium]